MPVLMYGCEMWSLTKKQQSKVQAAQMNQEGVIDLVKRRQESWKGRLEDMSFEKTTKKVFVGEMEGKRPRGRPHLRWIDNFK